MFLPGLCSVTVRLQGYKVGRDLYCRFDTADDEVSSRRNGVRRSVIREAHLWPVPMSQMTSLMQTTDCYSPIPPPHHSNNVTGRCGILESLCPCVRLCSENIFWTVQPFVTKLGMVILQNKLECHAKKRKEEIKKKKKAKLGCCRHGQGQSKWLYNQNMTVCTISSERMILLQPNLVRW